MIQSFKVAVDGPAGSGKTSIMRKVAELTNLAFIDTGLMYRAFTKFCVEQDVDFTNSNAIDEALHNFHCEFRGRNIYVNNKNYMPYVNSQDVILNINKITTLPNVRSQMVLLQKAIAQMADCVLTGRDITTVVLPDAQVKIYLDCSIEARAKRRYEQNKRDNADIQDYETIYQLIHERDESDKNRTVGPLMIAHDAIVVDNSSLGFEECVNKIVAIIQEKKAN